MEDVAQISILVIIVLLAMAFLVSQGLSGTSIAHKTYTISISATGASSAYPQSALMYLFINGSGKTAQAATQNISLTLSAVNGTLLKYVDGNASAISTESYSLSRYSNATLNTSGYTAAETVGVKIPEVSNVSYLVGELSLIPDVYVSSVSAQLTSAQIAALRSEAISLAVQNATQQAQVVAGLGVSISLGNVTVNSYGIYPLGASYPVASSGGFQSSAVAPSSPVFYAGQSEITESVSTTFYYTR